MHGKLAIIQFVQAASAGYFRNDLKAFFDCNDPTHLRFYFNNFELMTAVIVLRVCQMGSVVYFRRLNQIDLF